MREILGSSDLPQCSAFLFAPVLVSAILSTGFADRLKLEDGQETREQAVAAIEKLGGEVYVLRAAKGSFLEVTLTGPDVSDEILTHLRPLDNLVSLDLSDSQITDNGLAKLKQCNLLRTLKLSGTRITGTGIQYLKALPELESLELWKCPIRNAG